ncbi:LysM peptidoglycan-binding domain-containing protein [Psychromicrobium xiongbiense]|uniref:LysM peptidoglycan-binding domain-containing protein n=1 Tax=Psychromicrobium xiongbiense TaxID=3051184 RepID=UPI00255313CB|nr:LysM peptidoglycan-binding domain-containing protein [Psychromicrobium sp. YIM S02556]
MTLSILLLGAALLFCGSVTMPRFGRTNLWNTLELADVVAAIAIVSGLAVTLWWVLSLIVSLSWAIAAKRHPGRSPRVVRIAPTSMQRTVAVLVGLQLALAPSAQAGIPTLAAPTSPAWTASSSDSSSYPLWKPSPSGGTDPSWHLAPQANPSPSWKPSPGEASSPARPASPSTPPKADTNPAVGASPLWQPSAPATTPGLLAPAPQRPVIGAEQSHVVRPGDSLWSIAARALGPLADDAEIARAWPLWYALNRSVIGEDAHLIQPGQILLAPPAR